MKFQSLFLGAILLLLVQVSFTAVTTTNLKDKPKIPHGLLPTPTTYTYGTDTISIADPCNFSFNFMTKDTIPQVTQLTALYRKYMFGKSCKTFPKELKTLTVDHNSILNIHVDDIKNYLMNTNTDESYTLLVQDGFFDLKAATYLGLVRGLETFSQLITVNVKSDKSLSYSIQAVPVNIADTPRFTHRGIMVDTSRHFITKQKLFELMDAMLSAKMNVFHWHLTDSDSFPIEIPSRPSLSKYGAFSEAETYKKADVQEIVNYALVRGIKIIPEIDSPSHTGAWALAPEYANLVYCADSIWYRGIPFGQLNPTRDETYKLFADIFNDLKSYFPWDSVHLGSDEVFSRCWNTDEVNNFMKKNNIPDYNALFNYYLDRVRPLVDKSKTRYVWSNPDTAYLKFQSDEVLQWWGTTGDLPAAMNKNANNKYVLSNYEYLYLDCGAGNYFGNKSWCDPYHTWYDIYNFEPAKTLKKDQLSRVLGYEAALWSELNDDSTLLNKIFPRTASLAEKSWSPQDHSYGSSYSVFVRLMAWRKRVADRGINVQPISAGYCEKRPDMCFD